MKGIRIPGVPAPPRNRAYADQQKEAATPRDTRVSIVAAACRSPRTARTWNGHELQTTTGAASTKHSHCQLRNCRTGAIDRTRTGTDNRAVTSSRCRSSRSPPDSGDPAGSDAFGGCARSGGGGAGSSAL